MREKKFRAWVATEEKMFYEIFNITFGETLIHFQDKETGSAFAVHPDFFLQFTGLLDKNGTEIFEGDIIEFSDKWEWYGREWAWKFFGTEGRERDEVQAEYDALPMERRAISLPDDYDWILHDEIQSYWKVIGNIYENPGLLKTKETDYG